MTERLLSKDTNATVTSSEANLPTLEKAAR